MPPSSTFPPAPLSVTGFLLLAAGVSSAPAPAQELPGFRRSPWFGERVWQDRTPEGVRVLVNLPPRLDPERPTRLIVYATPNGNSLEETLGEERSSEKSWRFDIQHAAAQVRKLREVNPRENLVLACVEAEGKSWPAWRARQPENGRLLRELVAQIRKRVPVPAARVTLTGHSGGGSFLLGYVAGGETIPDEIDRIAFLDANYSYSDDAHAGRFLAWLRGQADRKLIVLAYDDRRIELDGKLVVGPTGGTFRASHRMLDRLRREGPIAEEKDGPMAAYRALDGRALFWIHENPENKILHTTMVGEWNGLLHALTVGTPEAVAWGKYAPPRTYTRWVQPALAAEAHPLLGTVRAPSADTGPAVLTALGGLMGETREKHLFQELIRGNVAPTLRNLLPVRVTARGTSGKEHTIEYQVTPDYLGVGGDADFVRAPMTPMTAQRIADLWDCTLPTRKMVDDIYRQANVKLEPRPLTEAREAPETFLQHHRIIEGQRPGTLGKLVAGIKKDVVLTNRLREKPARVAIYGWHKLDGNPIQPLTIVHKETYVDYSHGVRLVRREVRVDGNVRDLVDVFRDPELHPLVSDEGPLEVTSYPMR